MEVFATKWRKLKAEINQMLDNIVNDVSKIEYFFKKKKNKFASGIFQHQNFGLMLSCRDLHLLQKKEESRLEPVCILWLQVVCRAQLFAD